MRQKSGVSMKKQKNNDKENNDDDDDEQHVKNSMKQHRNERNEKEKLRN